MKLLIVGKSATGKDTLADILSRSYGYKRAESYTTRPKRTPDEKGHRYIDSADGYDKIALVTINGYEYFLTKQEIQRSDAIIVEPSGIRPVCEACPDEAFYLLYITADEKTRRALYKTRDPNASDTAFNKREYEENKRFEALEKLINNDDTPWDIPNIAAVTAMENRYDKETMDAMVSFGRTIRTRHMNMKFIITVLAEKGALHADKEGNLLVQDGDGGNSVTSVPKDIFTAVCLSSDKNKKDLFDLWLTFHNHL